MLQTKPNSKPYSWAGHCRFKINEKDPDYKACFPGISTFPKVEGSENFVDEKPNVLKCQKLNANITAAFSRYNLHPLKPIKETYVCLRNETIVKNLKIRRPRYVHLYSHPLKKVTSEVAERLRSLKNMKLLTFRDYGFQISTTYCQEGVDLEEGVNRSLVSEGVLKMQELSYLLSSTYSLRKLYVMLYSENWKVFKRLQSYARKQKNLKGFGFISHCKIRDRAQHQYDISSLGPKLEHLEVIWVEGGIKIRGLDKLQKLSCYTDGSLCYSFPSTDNWLDVGDGEEEEEEEENDPYGDSPLSQISKLFGNQRFETLEFKFWELESWSLDFSRRIDSFFKFISKSRINLTFEIVLDQYRSVQYFINAQQERMKKFHFQGTVQILILDDFYLQENCENGYGLKTDLFNFDKQYLLGIEKYKIKETLSLPNTSSGDSGEREVKELC